MKVSHRLTRATGSSSLYQHMERILSPVVKKRLGKTKMTNKQRLKCLNNRIKIHAHANGGPHYHFYNNNNLIINKFLKKLIDIKNNIENYYMIQGAWFYSWAKIKGQVGPQIISIWKKY